MAAPIASYIQLPADTANTGKKNRTQTKVVGSDTAHEHFMVPSPSYTHTGRYFSVSTAAQGVSSVAQTPSTAGHYYLHNSTANTAVGVLRSVDINYSVDGSTAIAITQSCPLFMLQKYVFGTAHSGTTISIVSAQTSSTTPKLNMRQTPTGPTTFTLVGPIGAAPFPALLSTVTNSYGGSFNLYKAEEHYNRGTAVEIAPGEGVVLHQLTTGLAADCRKFTAKFVWDEIDVS
jgi:hypothetical protein